MYDGAVDDRRLRDHWAEVLGLDPHPHGPRGERDGFRFQISAVASGRYVLWCAHRRGLRLGLAVQPIPQGRLVDAYPDRPIIELPPSGLGASVRARAAERPTARAVLLEAQHAFLPLLDAYASPFIDDRRVGVHLSVFGGVLQPLWAAAELTRASDALVAARDEWEAPFETAIDPTWRRAADDFALRFRAGRSSLRGERHGAKVAVRIRSEPLLLYTEATVVWPSLARELSFERRARHGEPLGDEAGEDDEERTRATFRRGFGEPATEVPLRAMEGAVAVAGTGASLVVDDTGLVAWIGRVVADQETLTTLLRGAFALTDAFLGPAPAPTGAYR